MKLACSKCGMEDVRLWRDYNTFLHRLSLYCVGCALQASPDYGYDPAHPACIGNLVAARPTDNGSFWGHSSGPDESVAAWMALPLARGGGA